MGRNLKKYLEAGKIANTHGVRGDVIIDSMCDSPKILAGIKTLYIKQQGEYKAMKVARSAVHAGRVLTKFVGIETLDEVLAYKGKTVYAAREDLAIDEDSVFIADLIGLDVIDIATGEKLGTLADVLNLGASDLYEIKTPSGKKLIPAVPEFIKEIDLDKGIFVALIEGMLD